MHLFLHTLRTSLEFFSAGLAENSIVLYPPEHAWYAGTGPCRRCCRGISSASPSFELELVTPKRVVRSMSVEKDSCREIPFAPRGPG